MENTAKNSEDSTPPKVESAVTSQERKPGSIPGRALAAFIDYLVVTALMIFLSRHDVSDSVALGFSLMCAFVYYGVGNSTVTGGKTLGKKAFGLCCCRLGEEDRSLQLLSLPESILRAVLSVAGVLLLSEGTVLVLRDMQFVGPPALLELHMLVISIYVFSNIASAILHPDHRAVHDRLSGTVVVHAVEFAPNTRLQKNEQLISYYNGWIALIGTAMGVLIWLSSVSHHPQVAAVHTIRYPLETALNTRILNIQYQGGILFLQLTRPTDTNSNTCASIVSMLNEKSAILSSHTNSLDITLAHPSDDWSRCVYNVKTAQLTDANVDDLPSFFTPPKPQKQLEQGSNQDH